jgi:hypothetical protein
MGFCFIYHFFISYVMIPSKNTSSDTHLKKLAFIYTVSTSNALSTELVNNFADEWGFIKTPTKILNSVQEVRDFTYTCAKTENGMENL